MDGTRIETEKKTFFTSLDKERTIPTLYEWLYLKIVAVETSATELAAAGIDFAPTLYPMHEAYVSMLGDIPIYLLEQPVF